MCSPICSCCKPQLFLTSIAVAPRLHSNPEIPYGPSLLQAVGEAAAGLAVGKTAAAVTSVNEKLDAISSNLKDLEAALAKAGGVGEGAPLEGVSAQVALAREAIGQYAQVRSKRRYALALDGSRHHVVQWPLCVGGALVAAYGCAVRFMPC